MTSHSHVSITDFVIHNSRPSVYREEVVSVLTLIPSMVGFIPPTDSRETRQFFSAHGVGSVPRIHLANHVFLESL